MSFNVFLQAFADGEPTLPDRAGVLSAFEDFGFRDPLAGWHVVETEDGGAAELAGGAADSDFGFFVRSFTPLVAGAIWNLASRGRMVLLPAVEADIVVLTEAVQEEQLPVDVGEPHLAESGDDLFALLEEHSGAWRRYRDVAERPDPRP